jgi:hypothetical protein
MSKPLWLSGVHIISISSAPNLCTLWISEHKIIQYILAFMTANVERFSCAETEVSTNKTEVATNNFGNKISPSGSAARH